MCVREHMASSLGDVMQCGIRISCVERLNYMKRP